MYIDIYVYDFALENPQGSMCQTKLANQPYRFTKESCLLRELLSLYPFKRIIISE